MTRRPRIIDEERASRIDGGVTRAPRASSAAVARTPDDGERMSAWRKGNRRPTAGATDMSTISNGARGVHRVVQVAHAERERNAAANAGALRLPVGTWEMMVRPRRSLPELRDDHMPEGWSF